MARAFPDAPIYTTLYDPDGTYPEFRGLDIRPSILNKVGFLRRNHRAALPLLPLAASSIRIDADVVLVSSSGWAHGFKSAGSKVVYCYSPARWLYQPDAYLGESAGKGMRTLLALVTPALKRWDRRAASTASRYFAISSVVEPRIRDAYGIDATILPAPQSLDSTLPTASIAQLADWAEAGYYLCISRLLPYKNVDKVMRAFHDTDRKLVVVGSGPQETELNTLTQNNIRMVKNLSDAQIRWLYRHCRGLVAASYEDFGLTPLEAASYGKPSAVLRWGGFLDTVAEGETGVYFNEPEPVSIRKAVMTLDDRDWPAGGMDNHLDQFSEQRFAEALHNAVDEAVIDAERSGISAVGRRNNR
ncbi:glycosyltransferase [Rhodococcoides fascians]|uniref:glycosyltransferase n=1 Tax=Rhodococcoides fascians TaxID=1828 RepID=UPI001427E88D